MTGTDNKTEAAHLRAEAAALNARAAELDPPAQLDRAALKGMTPDQIVTAKTEGKLDRLLGIQA